MACKTKLRYSQEGLQNAIRAVENGKSLSAAAAEFSIPKSTLYGQTSGIHKRIGRGGPTVLQLSDEQEIVLFTS